MLKVENLYGGYGSKEILKDISFEMKKGEFLCILGANGCGKTTLLKNILGFLKPFKGSIFLEEKNMHRLSEKEIARKIAYIPQAHTPPFPYTVFDVILMGRTPYIKSMASPGEKDIVKVEKLLKELDFNFSSQERYTELSGGQRQMVIIARALAQEPDILIMDEPTANLDFGNQYGVLKKMKELADKGLGIIMVTHNPEHALYSSSQTMILKDGKILEIGKTREVINKENLEAIYQTEMKIVSVPLDDQSSFLACVPSL